MIMVIATLRPLPSAFEALYFASPLTPWQARLLYKLADERFLRQRRGARLRNRELG